MFSKLILNIQKDYYPVASDKLEIKREILSHYQLKIADFYNIPIGNVKRLVPNFLIKKIMCFIMKMYSNFTLD